MGYREELETEALRQKLQAMAKEKTSYEGDDKDALADKEIFGMHEFGDSLDSLMTDINNEKAALAKKSGTVHPYLTTKPTAELMAKLKENLLGIKDGKEYLVNLVREMMNKDEEERQKMEAAAKVQKEQLDESTPSSAIPERT